MRQLPELITFTGIDAQTDLQEALELSALYPVEFGVLLSPKRQGIEPRYPAWEIVQEIVFERMDALANGSVLRLSAHLCGGYANEINDHGHAMGIDAVLGRFFDRAQVNHREPYSGNLSAWGVRVGLQVIMQEHQPGTNPSRFENVSVLFDPSGGRGKSPDAWPQSPNPGVLYGFAGGLNPDNVDHAVRTIGATRSRYWLDMETGVRDDDDRFSLEKCRAVCEAVYGKSLFGGEA